MLRVRARGDESADDILAEGEDAIEFGANEEAVEEGTAAGDVGDAVADGGAGFAARADSRLEEVLVVPEFVGAAALFIDKASRGLVLGDLGSPSHGDAADADGVIDDQPRFHVERGRGKDFETECLGGDGFEVACVGEEGEDALEREGKKHRGIEDVGRGHKKLYSIGGRDGIHATSRGAEFPTRTEGKKKRKGGGETEREEKCKLETCTTETSRKRNARAGWTGAGEG